MIFHDFRITGAGDDTELEAAGLARGLGALATEPWPEFTLTYSEQVTPDSIKTPDNTRNTVQTALKKQ